MDELELGYFMFVAKETNHPNLFADLKFPRVHLYGQGKSLDNHLLAPLFVLLASIYADSVCLGFMAQYVAGYRGSGVQPCCCHTLYHTIGVTYPLF